MTAHPTRRSVRGALIIVFVSRYTTLAINFAAMILLARLLAPAETGLFSVAASIVLLAQAVRDFGIGEFLVQERDLTPAKIRTAFGMTLILSWSLGLIIFLSRGLIADIYHTPELAGLITIVTGSFLVAPFSSTVMALLNREMAFGALFRISLISTIANQAVSVALALLGYGAAALTWGMLAANVATAIVAGLHTRSRDHLIPSLREWRALAAFGAYISSANIIDQIGARAPDLIIGRLIGYQALGLFNRANGVIGLFTNMIVTGVQAVAFPAFSDAHRAGEELRAPYLRTVTLISGVMLPVLAMLAIVARSLIETLLGPNWIEAAPLVPLLCVGAAADSLAPLVVSFLNATGHVSRTLRIALSIRGAQLALTCGLAFLGLWWLAVGQVILGVFSLLVNAHHLHRAIGVRLGDLLRAGSRGAAVAVLTALPPLLILGLRAGASDSAFLSLGLTISSAALSWTVAILILRHPLGREFGAMSREMRVLAGRRVA